MRHLSGIDKGIQHSHSLQEYNNRYPSKEFDKWRKKDLNVVILQAPCTSRLKEASAQLKKFGVKVAEFREPDLDNALTSITFLLDERVFNKSTYFADGSEIHKELIENPSLLKIRQVVKQFPLAHN